MKREKKTLVATFLFGAAGLSLVSGCKVPYLNDGSSANQSQVAPAVMDKDSVLLMVDGKPVLTIKDYENQLDIARKSNQQIEMMLQMMPNAEKEIYKGIALSKLIQVWIDKKGISEKEDFKKQRKQLHEAMDQQLYMKAFMNENPVSVSDSEVKDYYENKKDEIQGLKISSGGVKTAYVRFDSKDKAEDFLKIAKKSKDLKDFKSDAEKEELKVAEASISEKSKFDKPIKNAVLSLKKFPSTKMVKVDKDSYWVLFAYDKSEAEYHSFKDVSPKLKKMLEEEKMIKEMQALPEKMKSDFKIEENDDYFDKKESKKREALEAMSKKMAKHEDDEASEEADKAIEKL